MEKFILLTDLHWGYERRGGHKVALHDTKALNVALKFVQDFKPDHIILGGDMLDCGAISHHNHGKPGAVEGFRLLADAKELRNAVITPLEATKPSTLTYIVGNHEDWLSDLAERMPALEEIVDIRAVLGLGPKWTVVPSGGAHKLGKLVFVHGDQMSGGEHAAKAAVLAFERNIRFGHFHTATLYTKNSPIDEKAKTGMSVPCLCRKGPKYGGGAPNRWTQGFLFGYILPGGNFSDYLVIITNGEAVIHGKHYKG